MTTRGMVVSGPAPELDAAALDAELAMMRAQPEAAACILALARRFAWTTTGNTVGAPYAERRDLMLKLRGAVSVYEARP